MPLVNCLFSVYNTECWECVVVTLLSCALEVGDVRRSCRDERVRVALRGALSWSGLTDSPMLLLVV